MTNIRNSLAGLLLLAFLATIPAFAGTAAIHHGYSIAGWLVIGITALGVIGNVVTTYNFQPPPATTLTSSTTAPTAAQAALIVRIAAVVFMADTETTTTLTHNWKLSANALALLMPDIIWYWTTAGTATVEFALTDSSTITITKASGTGSGGTFNVVLYKPHTIIGQSSS